VSQHPSSGVSKTVTAASGTGHNTGAATSLQRGLIGTQSCTVWLKPATQIPPQPSHTEPPTNIETRTHDQCGDIIEKSQAPDDGCINIRNMLSIEEVK